MRLCWRKNEVRSDQSNVVENDAKLAMANGIASLDSAKLLASHATTLVLALRTFRMLGGDLRFFKEHFGDV
jgi:hypothetical protein